MSLVQAYVYHDFVLVCGEQYAKLSNGTILEDFVKVRKLNNVAIIGMTGTIEGNYILFQKFINEDFTLKSSFVNKSYTEIFNIVQKSYYENYEILQSHSVHSILCGWDGNKMLAHTFFTKDTNPNVNGINTIVPNDFQSARVINCGLSIHHTNALELGKQISNINILQMKNLFKNVLNIGIKLDDTINKNITFEKIRKVDVI